MTAREKPLGLDEVVGQIGRMTQHLLEEGAEPSQVAFALTSVAADMGLQLTGDPLQVLPVLLDAISGRARDRLQKRQEENAVVDAAAELPAERNHDPLKAKSAYEPSFAKSNEHE